MFGHVKARVQAAAAEALPGRRGGDTRFWFSASLLRTRITGEQRKQLQRAGDAEQTRVGVHLISEGTSGPRAFQGGGGDGSESRQMRVTLTLGNKQSWCKAAGESFPQPGPWCCPSQRGNPTTTEQGPPAQDQERDSRQSRLLIAVKLGANSFHFRQQERKGSAFGKSQAVGSLPRAAQELNSRKMQRPGRAWGCVSHFAPLTPAHTAREAICPQTPTSELRVLFLEHAEILILELFFFKPSYKPYAFLLLQRLPAASA